MSQPITKTQIRQNVVREAIDRATRDCLFLFVYEYQGSLSENTAWAALLEHEQPPKDSLLLCTVNQNGVVDWKIDDHDLTQIPTPPITLPIDQVTFDNVSITIPISDPAAAYTALCAALARFEFTTDTFQTDGAAGTSEQQCTSVLFRFPLSANQTRLDPNTNESQSAEVLKQQELLTFIVDFCSERLEWFCGDCYRDSPEVVWLENARAQLRYPPLDFTEITFAQEPHDATASKPTCFVIESREAGEEDGRWQEWNSHTDPAQLLRAFVNSVSSEEIDDVNRYWRVRETPVADDKQTTQPHMQDAALPVIITLNDAKASVISNPQRPVNLINFDELRDTSDSSLALDLIDAIRATPLPTEEIETLVTQITEAAQYICARCETPIPLGKDHSTPSGSMHDDCAHDYEQENPSEF